MPEKITLINKRTKLEKKLLFEHALRLLIIDRDKKYNDFTIKGKYKLEGNDIIRQRGNTDNKDQEV